MWGYVHLGYPSILVPQLISSNNTDIVMDNDSKGWVVSLDYGTTAIIALVSGQFQASHGLCFLCFVWSYCKRRDHLIQQKKSQGWLKKRGSCLGLFGPSYGVFGLWNQKCRQNPSLILLDDRWCSDLRRRVWWPASPSLWPGYWWPTPTISTPSTPAGQWWRKRKNPHSVLDVQDVDRTGQWNPHLVCLHSGGGGGQQEGLCSHGKNLGVNIQYKQETGQWT